MPIANLLAQTVKSKVVRRNNNEEVFTGTYSECVDFIMNNHINYDIFPIIK